MVEFLLNNRLVKTQAAASTTLLDFIRYDENLRGTKIGCREGDCGACTVLIGSLKDGKTQYRSATSCLTPLANAHGKHIVTVEGLNLQGKLNRAQQAMVDCSGTQCGFCTPGFISSLCGYALNATTPDLKGAISAIDGNICRCTGYKSIERAAGQLSEALLQKDHNQPLEWLVNNEFLPDYFLEVSAKLAAIQSHYAAPSGTVPIGGGTDIYVQKHDSVHEIDLDYLFDKPALNGITFNGDSCTLQSSVTVTELMEHPVLLEAIPNWHAFLKLLSSTPIRNIATIAGNIANASPIGDFTIILMALKATLTLSDKQNQTRQIALKDFYLGYKTLNKQPNEIISSITFNLPKTNKFNFEKVCKRQYLDIASVNTAFQFSVNGNTITEANGAIGGVGPIPKFLSQTCEFLAGKEINAENIRQAEALLQTEISPISDARGTIAYKRLLARQLFFAHFITLFPETIQMHDLL